LTARKHVLLEKPMTVSVKDTEKLKAVTKKFRDKILMVGFQYIYNDYVRYIKNEIEKGYFGKMRMFKSESLRIPANREVGVFWDAAPHPLSVFQYLFGFGRMARCVGAIIRDSASFTVKFTDKPILNVVLAFSNKQKVRKLTLVGEKAELNLDETLDKNKLVVIKDGKKIIPPITTSEIREPLQNELDYFIHCVRNKKVPLTNFNFGAKITELLENIEFCLRK